MGARALARSFSRIAAVTCITLSLGGCATANFGPRTGVGAAAGAAAGGLIGATADSGPVGIFAGALLGGLAGGAIGQYLDQRDVQRYDDRDAYGYGDRHERRRSQRVRGYDAYDDGDDACGRGRRCR